METNDVHAGRCHCGAVQFEVAGASTFDFLCHCTDCRQLNGGGRLAGATFQRSHLKLQGEVQTYSYTGGSGQPIHLSFCGTCATPLFAVPTRYEGAVVVRASVFDDASWFKPVSIFGERAHPWDIVRE